MFEYSQFALNCAVQVIASRMWDDSIADPSLTRKLPFASQASAYIEVLSSAVPLCIVRCR